jgi:hypothetical protein
MTSATVEQYIATWMPVPGWFSVTDAWLFTAISRRQTQDGVGGHLLEVGAYLGKSSILLGCLIQPGEELHICDLFESEKPSPEIAREHERFYEGLAVSRFLNNYRRFIDADPVLHVGPSAETLRELEGGRFRLIHIDGSHSYEAVVEDVRQSRRLLHERGVVILDDVSAHHTPGVAAAVWDAVLHSGLDPIVRTGKLYATWDTTGRTRRDVMRAVACSDRVRIIDSHDIAGHAVAEVVGETRAEPRLRRIVRGIAPPIALQVAQRARRRRG